MPGAFIDRGDYYRRDDTSDVPAGVLAEVRRQLAAWRAEHGRGTWPPTHRHCGASQDRQWIGNPGHCSVCAIVGHVVAHPERGCDDVRCDSLHDEPAGGNSLDRAVAAVMDGAFTAADTAMAAGLGAGEATLDRLCDVLAVVGHGLDRAAERIVSWVVKF